MTEKGSKPLNQAFDLASQFHNSLHEIAQGSVRKALQGERDTFGDSLWIIRNLLSTGRAHESPALVAGTFRNAFVHHQMLLDLIKLIWPELPGRKTAADAVHFLMSTPLAGGKKLQAIITEFERRFERTDAFYARIVAAGLLCERVEEILKVDTSSTHVASIHRSITFPPEFKQAGIAILSYFSEVVQNNYPDMNVGVTIEQKGDKVTLIIDTPAGERERIEQELRSYGLVVAGEVSPEQFMRTQAGAISLKHKLELAALEVRHTRELLYAEREQYGQRIRSLENQTLMLREFLDREKYTASEIATQLRALTFNVAASVETSLRAIIALLERGVGSSDIEELKTRLSDLEREDKGIFDMVGELIIKGSIQGTAGNYLYAALQALNRMA